MKKNDDNLIIKTVYEKYKIKKQAYNNTNHAFKTLKKLLEELVGEYNTHLKEEKSVFEYRNRGRFETEMKIAEDLLIFNMYTNIFEFDRSHPIWQNSYVADNENNSYVGIINIYNFLSDSFKYNRSKDLGYLIGRIFVNRELHFFVEGKRQLGFLYNDFGNAVLTKEALLKVIQSAILYSLDFDLFVPPYNEVKIISVSQIQEKINSGKTGTGKRLGFQFYVDNDNLAKGSRD